MITYSECIFLLGGRGCSGGRPFHHNILPPLQTHQDLPNSIVFIYVTLNPPKKGQQPGMKHGNRKNSRPRFRVRRRLPQTPAYWLRQQVHVELKVRV